MGCSVGEYRSTDHLPANASLVGCGAGDTTSGARRPAGRPKGSATQPQSATRSKNARSVWGWVSGI